MQQLVAFDAGGTSTRAVIMDRTGACLGYGHAGSGNPVSSGIFAVQASLRTALQRAAQQHGQSGSGYSSAIIAMAGSSVQTFGKTFADGLSDLGLQGRVVIESDLLATFFSATYHDQGYALVAGTGAIAARIRAGQLDAVADGMGWLLGDAGSGFWIGHQVVRAVCAALDGRGPKTSLCVPLLAALGIDPDLPPLVQGRAAAAQQLIDAVYELVPVELSQFAPLAFDAVNGSADGVAQDILARAARALSTTLSAVLAPAVIGPLVFGGSILARGSALAAYVEEAAGGSAIRVADGVVGAAVLALRHAGTTIDAEMFARIRRTLADLRSA
ncbi:hypothetical protein IV500_15710 [Paeniglutamicibacter antarcticus]|uniref:ATPase BadF/BadG/BcrA/BcrD type domain-containing protein n=1 Tax=Arthrobacter terrae TaxID=2935737 RepID=A0A931CPT8_9MICC|nr:BadF/BadG/BcrA/BcrD ATPase family protein [Arthrobacter terrae]MBG0740822.1 hypothetical protein [Arthrobacter terrae]